MTLPKNIRIFYDFIYRQRLAHRTHFKEPKLVIKVAAGLFKRGVLVAGTLTSAHTIRIEPPLVITYEQIDAVLNRIEDVLKEITAIL